MYRSQPHLGELPEETVLWRYMPLSRFESIVERSAIYMRRADLFDDPLEGMTTHGTANAIFRELPTDIAGVLVSFKNLFRAKMFVSCWFENEFEDSTMWAAYGDRNYGVAITTTVGNLKRAIRGPEICFLGKVKYVDFRTHEASGDVHKALLLKRREFSRESETRLIHDVGMPGGILSDVGRPDDREGIFVDASLNDLITGIFVGPKATPETDLRIRDLAAKIDKLCLTQKSDLYGRS
jgi:hypothetical protein